MGATKVLSTIIEWGVAALRENPLLVGPTLIIALGVIGLAIVEGITITMQVATVMIGHYRRRFSDLWEAWRALLAVVFPKSWTRNSSVEPGTIESARPRLVQKERLAQQELFDRHRRPSG